MTRIHSQPMTISLPLQRHAWLFLLLGLLLSFSAVAQEAGRLLFVRGDVQLDRGGEVRLASRGDTVAVGDILRTGAGASAQLRLSDGAMVALRPDSLFRIEAQDYDSADPAKGSQAGELLRGGLRAITGAIGKERPEAVKLSTPVATIGIRGTVYDTVYVPPEGLPGMPDLPPGQYTMVIKGRIVLANAGGELNLAAGEIAYVPDGNTAPQLRPDLAWLFERYSTLQGGAGLPAVGSNRAPQIGEVDKLLAEVVLAKQRPEPVVSAGPLALIAANDSDGINAYRGSFLSEPVVVGPDGALFSAQNGSGDITSFDVGTAQPMSTPMMVEAGDSLIYWGAYDGTVTIDAAIDTGGSVNYVHATQVLATVYDLPTTGSYTYNYVGGSGEYLESTSYLMVDFGTATMDISLDQMDAGSWVATNQSVSDFYGSGITLSNSMFGTGGEINGAFVGSNAEGAITVFELDYGSTVRTGTGVFVR